MTTAAEVGQALGGHREGRNWRCRCPVHGSRSSQVMVVSDGRNGEPMVHCFAGCDWKEIKAALIGMGVLAEHKRDREDPQIMREKLRLARRMYEAGAPLSAISARVGFGAEFIATKAREKNWRIGGDWREYERVPIDLRIEHYIYKYPDHIVVGR